MLPLLDNIHIGPVDESPPNWRDKPDESPDDDEVTETDADVAAILGFDPATETDMKDTEPRTLYVSRKLINADDLRKWAKDQGFSSILSNLHVTLIYSKTPVDWMAIGADYPYTTPMTIQEGGPRQVLQFGPNGAVVLAFASTDLKWRNEAMIEKGCTTDYPDYQPHLTISYKGAPADISEIEPYQGELKFGPEIFKEITPEMLDPSNKPDFPEVIL